MEECIEFFDSMINDNVNIWLCTYGGCKSNNIWQIIENTNSNIKIYSKNGYDIKGCHYINPIANKKSKNFDIDKNGIKCGIFLFSKNPFISLSSMMRRKDHTTNYTKLTDKINFDLDDWIKNIELQVKNWTDNPIEKFDLDYPIIYINTDKFNELQPILVQYLKEIFGSFNNINYVEKDRVTKCVNNELENKLDSLVNYQNTLEDIKIFRI